MHFGRSHPRLDSYSDFRCRGRDPAITTHSTIQLDFHHHWTDVQWVGVRVLLHLRAPMQPGLFQTWWDRSSDGPLGVRHCTRSLATGQNHDSSVSDRGAKLHWKRFSLLVSDLHHRGSILEWHLEGHRYFFSLALFTCYSFTNSCRATDYSGGITVAMGRIIAQIARNFATDLRKQSLGLGPFITRIVYYLEINIARADLTV